MGGIFCALFPTIRTGLFPVLLWRFSALQQRSERPIRCRSIFDRAPQPSLPFAITLPSSPANIQNLGLWKSGKVEISQRLAASLSWRRRYFRLHRFWHAERFHHHRRFTAEKLSRFLPRVFVYERRKKFSQPRYHFITRQAVIPQTRLAVPVVDLLHCIQYSIHNAICQP